MIAILIGAGLGLLVALCPPLRWLAMICGAIAFPIPAAALAGLWITILVLDRCG